MKKVFMKMFAVAAAMMLTLGACKTPTNVSNEYATYGFPTQCLGVDPNGDQTLRTWGNGVNKAEAIEQAKRNAVSDVLFKGINDGSADCSRRPIINEVNAREKYEKYFKVFFRDGGAYNKYVTIEENRTSRIKSKSSTMEAWSVVVVVNRDALRDRMIDDNVISEY